jgi:hypothetical protein
MCRWCWCRKLFRSRRLLCPGNNYWNPVVSHGTTGSDARWSDGITSSPITLTPQVAAPMVRREPGADRRHCNNLTSTTMLPGTNIAITLSAESWHTYQLWYKNAVTDPNWLNLGSPFNGNDTSETVITPISPSNMFCNVKAY